MNRERNFSRQSSSRYNVPLDNATPESYIIMFFEYIAHSGHKCIAHMASPSRSDQDGKTRRLYASHHRFRFQISAARANSKCQNKECLRRVYHQCHLEGLSFFLILVSVVNWTRFNIHRVYVVPDMGYFSTGWTRARTTSFRGDFVYYRNLCQHDFIIDIRAQCRPKDGYHSSNLAHLSIRNAVT